MPAKPKPRGLCPQCGSVLPRPDTRFCSRKCATLWKMERNAEKRDPCPQCGTPVASGNRFCSKVCANRWAGSKRKKPRSPCEHFGRPVPRSTSRFCSRACYAKWKLGRNAKNELSIERVPTVDGANAEVVCETCGTVFRVPHYMATKARFCCARCFGESRKTEHYEKHKKQSEDLLWRQSLRWSQFASAWLKAHPSCSQCGAPRCGRNLVVHHIVDPNPTRDETLLFAPPNLAVLCRSCHVKLHKPRFTPPAP